MIDGNNKHLFFWSQKKPVTIGKLSVKQIRRFCKLNDASIQLLKTAMERLNLSARAYDRILKVARTIADLDASETITGNHISEAIQYRSLDREGWFG